MDRVFIVRFRPPKMGAQPIIAAVAEVQGEYLVLLKLDGKLAALFWLEVVESWSASGL
jgi:hypothetical protein